MGIAIGRCIIVAAVGLFGRVYAQAPAPSPLPAKLASAAPCVSAAADYHRVNPWILQAILKVESGFNPSAVNRNANGTVDVGMAQINSIHFTELRKWGIAPAHLMNGCVATYVAAWHLANQIRVHGNTWYGIATYHSASPCQNRRYANLVWNTLTDWKVVPGPAAAVPSLASCGYLPPRQNSHSARGATPGSVAFDAD